MRRIPALIGLCLALSACAVGNTFDYRNATPPVTIATSKPVMVRVEDKRPYVLAGDNTPQWVGMFRGGFGNPFGAHTESGAPLADDVAVAVVASLRAQGVKAVLAPTVGLGDARTLTVTLKDWRSDSMYNTLIRFDLVAEVSDSGGKVFARNAKAGERTFSNVGTVPSATAKEVLGHFRTIMAELLNDPQIGEALR